MVKKSISNNEVIALSDSSAFLGGAKILLVDDDQPAVQASSPIDRKQQYNDIVSWGPGNNLPQEVIRMAYQSPELLALIQFVVYFMYGGGLTYDVFDEVKGKGRPEYIPGYDSEVEDFIERNNLSDYLEELIIDHVWFNHGFTEMILNKKRTKIVQVVQDEAAFCRFSKQNDQGWNDKVYINANWGSANYQDEYTIPVDCLNVKDVDLINSLKNSDAYKVIYPTAFPGPGKLVYQSANWHSLFKSGYFDISLLVPVLKRALMQYTMIIKYVIKVPLQFWINLAKDKGKDWNELNHAEKQALRKDVLKDMNDFLTGAENAGKSFVSTFGWDPHTQKEIPGISIEAIDDKMKDGVWIADGQEASAQFIRAHNLVPPVVGFLTGKGMGAGSGSDVRVHGNLQNKIMASRRHRILKPLEFAGKYNGFNTRLPGFRWNIKEFQFDTLDVNHSTANELPANHGNQSDQ